MNAKICSAHGRPHQEAAKEFAALRQKTINREARRAYVKLYLHQLRNYILPSLNNKHYKIVYSSGVRSMRRIPKISERQEYLHTVPYMNLV